MRLLEPGSGPRQPLRYSFKRKTESLRFEMKMIAALTIDSAAPPAPLPPDQRKKLVDDMRGLLGMRGRFVVTSRGVTRESTVDLPPSAPKAIVDTIDSLKSALAAAQGRVDPVSHSFHGSGHVHRVLDRVSATSTLHSDSKTKMMIKTSDQKQPFTMAFSAASSCLRESIGGWSRN